MKVLNDLTMRLLLGDMGLDKIPMDVAKRNEI